MKENKGYCAGAAGFIGVNLVMELRKTAESVHIVGLDNMNNYYDVSWAAHVAGEDHGKLAGNARQKTSAFVVAWHRAIRPATPMLDFRQVG